jgi:hypothetical protein
MNLISAGSISLDSTFKYDAGITKWNLSKAIASVLVVIK